MLGMANIDTNDPMAPYYFGGDSSAFNFFDHQSNKPASMISPAAKAEPSFNDGDHVSPTDTTPTADDMLYSPLDGTFSHFDSYSQAGTPAAGLMADGGWDNFIDFGSEQ